MRRDRSRRTPFSSSSFYSSTSSSIPCISGHHRSNPAICDDEDLLCEALASLSASGRTVTSLALLHLSLPPPPLHALAHLNLLELEISDMSYEAASEQGTFNLLVQPSVQSSAGGGILARGAAMIAAARAAPRLRRLSLACAAFPAPAVRSLATLTCLESLSLAGAVECPGGAEEATATHGALLEALVGLRQLRLPMAIARRTLPQPGGIASDSDDDDQVNGSAYEALMGGGAGAAAGINDLAGAGAGGGFRALATDAAGSYGDRWLAGRGMAGSESSAAAAALQRQGGCPAAATPAVVRRRGAAGSVARLLTFPPHLEDLTLPLCALNRPVFEALCAEYGCADGADGSWRDSERRGGAAGGSGSSSDQACAAAYWPAASSLRSNVPDLPRLTGGRSAGGHGGAGSEAVWEDAERRSRHAFPSPSCAGASGSSRGGCHPGPDAGGRPLGGRRHGGGALRSLHVPTLAGYSHWEGTFLKDRRDFELLSRLTCLESLHVSLELGALGPARDKMRACFQELRKLTALRDLRVSEAQLPAQYSVRKSHQAARRGGPFAGPPAPELSPAHLVQLAAQWPRLRCLQFFVETVVRHNGTLATPGLDQAAAMPACCACCAGPVASMTPAGGAGRG